jgi:hypothetical protein
VIERLEVAPGPGTVIRFGSVVAWASSSASPALLSFLAQSARNLGPSPVGGQHLADHLATVLGGRDPEPHVPFAVIGPSSEGWAALLHGPVQVWDGTQWVSANPRPGWLRCELSPRPSLSVTVAGAPVPAMSPDSIWDLEAGVVPGGGFLMLPAVRVPGDAMGMGRAGAIGGATLGDPGQEPQETIAHSAVGAGVTELERFGDREPEPGFESGPGRAGVDHETEIDLAGVDETVAIGGATTDDLGSETNPASATGPASGTVPEEPAGEPGPQGSLNLRSPKVLQRTIPYPPLPTGRGPDRAVASTPVVAGILCPKGHINRPAMVSCVRCGASIPEEGSYSVSGTRPALGCLIVDDGNIFRLDRGYLVGSNPTRDPTVRGGLALPLVLRGQDVSTTHAEIRLHDWDVIVTDRSSAGGTSVYEPDAGDWERLRPYDPRVLKPGTHIAFGQRVATFVTPWIPGHPVSGPE